MSSRPPLRRLADLPGIADLEYRALLKREFAEPQARAEFPELDACSRALFGVTADEAEAVERPAGWDNIETQPIAKQVFAFEDAGWDVTDDKRRPLRVLGHFNQQLWLAVRGVAGALPAVEWTPPDETPKDFWGDRLAAEAKAFRRR
jgi:hypothetical protein